MTAIVTDSHYRMATALIRDLKDNGVTVIACEYSDIQKPCGFYSNKVSMSAVISRENALSDLIELSEELDEKAVLFPVGASTLNMLCEYKDTVLEHFYCLLPDKAALDLLNDKEALGVLARTEGVPTPKEYTVDTVQLPCVVKPTCGEKFGLVADQRYRICRELDKFKSAFIEFYGKTGEPPIIQEYIEGKGQGVSVVAVNGEVRAVICHTRIREYPIAGGPSSCCLCEYDETLIEHTKKLVKATSFTGVAMFEYKDGRLLECNPRVWGTYPLTRVSKSNFAMVWMLSAMGEKCDFIRGNSVKMSYFPSDWMSVLKYYFSGQKEKARDGFSDIIHKTTVNGLKEKGDMRPYRVYLRSLFKR